MIRVSFPSFCVTWHLDGGRESSQVDYKRYRFLRFCVRNISCLSTDGPDRWNLNFIRKCMKINKIRSKLQFLKEFATKMTQLVFVFCVYCLFTFGVIWTPFYRVLSVQLVDKKAANISLKMLKIPLPSL